MATRRTKSRARPGAKRPAAARSARAGLPMQFHFRGALALERDRGGETRVHILTSAAEAEAFGVAADFAAKLFEGGRRQVPRGAGKGGHSKLQDDGNGEPPVPPDLCATVGGFGPDGFFVYCRDISCTAGGGEDCWMYSRKKDGSDERRGGGAPEPGRVYYCSCVYFA